MELVHESCRDLVSTRSVGTILGYGFGIRLVAVIYSIIHDLFVNHIKYTDIDYKVFTSGAQAIVNGTSPYQDTEFRYSPLVGLIFTPNILIDRNIGKFMLVAADILGGSLIYKLNIYQGANRQNSKLYLFYWLLNPVTVAISSRGSFEPILTLLILASVHYLIEGNFVLGGLLYGLAIHLKLYPIIYALAFYGYIMQKKPYMRDQSRIFYWMRMLTPSSNHWKFFSSALISLVGMSYLCYHIYGYQYVEQSFIYHLKRKDFQHNFSVYFYLFHLFPKYISSLNLFAFASQASSVSALSIYYIGFDTNRRVKMRKLYFSLFTTTYMFVTLNKVCTSQYFNWYLVFLPLVMDSSKMEFRHAYGVGFLWFMFQANWLLHAYLFEYQGYDRIDHVGLGSLLFLANNLYIIFKMCQQFDPGSRSSSSAD